MSALTELTCVGGPAADLLALQAEVVAVPVTPAAVPASERDAEGATARVGADEVTRSLLDALGADLDALAAAERMRGRAGEITRVRQPAGGPLPGSVQVLLVGIGDGGVADLRCAGAALGRASRGKDRLATTLLARCTPAGVRAGVEGLLLGGWAPQAIGTKNRDDARPVREALLVGTDEQSVRLGALYAEAAARARDLAVTPSNIKNPEWLAEVARQVAADNGLDITVWDTDRLTADGFGGILAVGAGSASPPRLVRLDYRPAGTGASARTSRGPVVLVGKGITFDTGGLSIKPREAMVPMKTDMSGAAAVLAALAACARLGVRRHVVGLLPLAENAVSGSSYRPSDVVRQYGGTTTEVTNTDAEGRVVLADALAYATTLAPGVIVDVATLTGAATLGLGRRHAALFATSEHLAAAIEEAAVSSGERVWRLPMVEDYRPSLDSQVADLRHIASDPHLGGGAIVAALFLREFTGGIPWAHLDIAGPARSDGVEHEIPKGATGFGARLLLRWLEGLR